MHLLFGRIDFPTTTDTVYFQATPAPQGLLATLASRVTLATRGPLDRTGLRVLEARLAQQEPLDGRALRALLDIQDGLALLVCNFSTCRLTEFPMPKTRENFRRFRP